MNMEQFDAYFRRADLDGDGRIDRAEVVAFFQGSNFPKRVLAQLMMDLVPVGEELMPHKDRLKILNTSQEQLVVKEEPNTGDAVGRRCKQKLY